MASFPTSLKSFTNLSSTTQMDDAGLEGDTVINALQDEVAALEAKVGVNSSAVTSTIDYKLTSPSSSDPGHKHTLVNGATDVTASAAELNIMDGVTASTAELNYTDGVTSAIQTQLDAKVDTTDTASTTASGIVELAIASEVNTGTDATRAITPDALAGSEFGVRYIGLPVFGPTTDIATGDGKFYFHIPPGLNGMNLVYAHGMVITAGTTNSTTVQIHNLTQTADMLTALIEIETGETGSDTAAPGVTIDTANDDVATNDRIRIDVDTVSTTAPKGLVVTLGFQLP